MESKPIRASGLFAKQIESSRVCDSGSLLSAICYYAQMRTEKTRQYFRDRYRRLREEWFSANGPCAKCGSSDRLELDHKDRTTKVSSIIWAWSKARRESELAKCQALCYSCHKEKTKIEMQELRGIAAHGTVSRYTTKGPLKCRCDECRLAWNDYKRKIYTTEDRHARYERTGH